MIGWLAGEAGAEAVALARFLVEALDDLHRPEHFRDARGVRGELEEKRVVEAVESLDRDVEFLETLAAALLRSRPSTTVRELLAEVEGAAPTTVIEV